MTAVFRFQEFPVYVLAREFRKELKQLSKRKFPKTEEYALRQQLWRAADSVVLNIAEGAERYSDKDFSKFLNTSIASVGEVMACVDLAYDDNYFSAQDKQYLYQKGESIFRQLKAFSSKVRKDGRYKSNKTSH